MKLLLDAGHGGKDPGAIGNNSAEAALNLSIVLQMEMLLIETQPNWKVVLTRRSDVYISPDERRRICDRTAPDAFVSVHCNAASVASATGSEVIYRDDLDLKLAEEIDRSLYSMLPLRRRGVKNDLLDLKRRLAVLSTPTVPSVIVEPGFITNPIDRKVLADARGVAKAIVNGIVRWNSSRTSSGGGAPDGSGQSP